MLDVWLAVTAWRQARREPYDLIHSHEEAGLLGVWLAKRLGIPHLYDMHSSLPQQLTNFRFAGNAMLRKAFEIMEDRTVFGSDVVITICKDLQDHVTAMGAGGRAVLIENVMGGDVEEPPPIDARRDPRALEHPARRAARALHGHVRALPGTRSAASTRWASSRALIHTCVRSSSADGRNRSRPRAPGPRRAGAAVVFTGYQPAREVPAFVAASDILASRGLPERIRR